MALEDFEKQLAKDKEEEKRRDRHRSDRKSEHRHHHRHHRSSKHRDEDDDRDRRRSRHHDYDDEDSHRSKRRRHSHDEDDEDRSHHRRHQHRRDYDQDETEGSAGASVLAAEPELKRASWMEAPSELHIDYVQRKQTEQSPPRSSNLGMDHELKIHEKEINHHLRDLKNSREQEELKKLPANHEVDYTIGDAGSHWRMTRLKAVYRKAEETGQKVEDVALERYETLREFDDAREEETELDRRNTYGDGYVGKDKPSGELYQERKLNAGVHRSSTRDLDDDLDEVVENVKAPAPEVAPTPKLDSTSLNRMKAQLMKARLKKDPKVDELQKEYDAAVTAFNQIDPTVVQLSAMDNRMLSSAPRNEVKAVQNRRGAERGNVEDNEDMTIEDMVREEKRTRDQAGGDAKRFAERIAKDGKFDNDLDYMDENAAKLAKRVHKSEGNLRNVAVGDYQKLQKVLENCQLCHHEDTQTPPVAPVVSLATRTYLTLPTEPELSKYGAMIVPIEHRTNLLECDEDEWEEIRNFMKSLTRLYHDQGRDVVFYENSARPNRRPHAAMNVVSLPYSLGETAPAFFQEAFLTTEDEWSQHKKIIDTLAKSKQGLGRAAFRKSLAKEMPYFHVWFELDGGIGHIVEDPDRWPRGDLFAREVIGGMLGLEPDVIKKQGRWHRGHDPRLESFRKRWRKFDWTRVLTEGVN
ncbi:uncharacterized protein HMPREF1541_03431 [Cyphellophora europaea CBS 101466]|uniref:Cwf19-like C-terminal domain-containing protein n=1 Tax=Cyphellophora europaea (strain CBS 101466) TaxID=1220924 RepID=W2RYU1_CYPE1|nr:uncharacterized protein HMPREF1541_03431 [Cyphellophora europaea CBS 101466]ETN41495.1 hypothetical protein HMPREF1541_03431 [Cyphellophora europaea CBS 101466]